MDWRTFIVEIVKAIAWPLAVILVSVWFRNELGALLARLKKGKVGPAEFEFDNIVQELTEEASALPDESTSEELEPSAILLAESHPRAAVIGAWVDLETSLRRWAEEEKVVSPQVARRPLTVIREIRRSQLVDPVQLALLDDLRALRNQAAHDPKFHASTEAVVNYVRLATGLSHYFQKLSGERRFKMGKNESDDSSL
jgi:hypothetical protein